MDSEAGSLHALTPAARRAEQMMRCDQARQLFDAYLDGELSAPLATELGAHRLRCPDCRQALALLEVSGHIVRTDQEPVRLERNFTERLLGCMDQRSQPWFRRWRRELYLGGTLAAAAVIALAFLGAFDNREAKVAGVKTVITDRGPDSTQPASQTPAGEGPGSVGAANGDAPSQEQLEAWIDRARSNLAVKRESGQSLKSMLDETATQWSQVLEGSAAAPVSTDEAPEAGADAPAPESGERKPDADRPEDG